MLATNGATIGNFSRLMYTLCNLSTTTRPGLLLIWFSRSFAVRRPTRKKMELVEVFPSEIMMLHNVKFVKSFVDGVFFHCCVSIRALLDEPRSCGTLIIQNELSIVCLGDSRNDQHPINSFFNEYTGRLYFR